MNKEHVGVTVVPAGDIPGLARHDADGAEANGTIAKTTGLALSLQQLTANVQDEVISLIYANRHEHSVAEPNEVRQDRALCALANVDWVATELRLRQS
jgi:hypothetical protein